MQLLRRLSFTMLMMSLMTLVGCGGGDGGDLTGGGGGGTDPDPTVIALTKSEGDLSGTNDVTITATVMEGTSAVANKLVTFTLSDDTLATFSPTSGTAVTNASGVATIVVKATSVAGGLDVTATVEDVDPVSIGLTSLGGGTGGETDELTIALTISNKDVSANNPSTVTAVVTEGGVAVVDQLVTFSIDNPELASFLPETGTANTNQDGVATIVITAAGTAGAGEITASIGEEDLATTTFNSLGDGNQGGSPNVASITLFASSQQIVSSGTQEVLLTAIAKDANNNLLEGVPVSFSADSGSLAKITDDSGQSSDKTGIDGRVGINLTTPAEPKNRIITIQATSGSVSDTLEVEVVGTSISLTGSSSLALNDDNTYVVKVLDSDGNAVKSGTIVNLSLSNESTEGASGNVAEITIPSSVQIGSDGQAIVTAIGTSGGTNTIIATSLGAIATQAVNVQADSFLFESFYECNSTNLDSCSAEVELPSSEIPEVFLSKVAKVTLKWERNGQAVSGAVVNYTTTRGRLKEETATTDANGEVIAYIESTNAGKALLTFTGIDTINEGTVNETLIELNNQLEFEFVADTAHRIVAQAFPVSIGPDAQTSTVSVVLKDPEGNLVKNKTVKFELDDVSGGGIYPPTAVTDSNGSASTVYTSNNTSAYEGITIKATVIGAVPEVSDTVNLTVSERAVFIQIGVGNTILQENINMYNKQHSIYVTDINSAPVKNTELTVSAIPKEYFKGTWIKYLDDEGEFEQWGPEYTAVCDNEDTNGNGSLDDLEGEEDTNGDNRLTPGNLVTVSGENSARIITDDQGHAMLNVQYGENYGYWANIELVVSGVVKGTESSSKVLINLDVSAEDVNNESVKPAAFMWPNGPFGAIGSCLTAD